MNRSADPQGGLTLAGLRFFAELKAVGAEGDSALKITVCRRIPAIIWGTPHASCHGLHRHSRESGNPEAGNPTGTIR